MVNTEIIFVSLICGPLSLLSSLFMIVIYLKFKKLRRGAASIIIMLSIGQGVYDIHWISGFPPVLAGLPAYACRIISSISFYGMAMVWLYNLALSFTIFRSIKKLKIKTTSLIFWHTGINFIAAFYALMLNVLEPSNSSFKEYTCTVSSKAFLLFFAIPALVSFSLSLFLAFYVYWLGKMNQIKYHLRITIIYSVCYCPLLIKYILEGVSFYDTYRFKIVRAMKACLVIASLSGFFVFIMRLTDKKLLRMIKKLFSAKKQQGTIEFSYVFSTGNDLHKPSIDSEVGYSLLFNSIHTGNMLSILSSLSHIFGGLDKVMVEQRDSWVKWHGEIEDTGTVRIEEFFHKEFEELRALDNLTDQEVYTSLLPEANEYGLDERSTNPGGKGHGFIFFTYDKKLIVKSIDSSELRAFVSIFPDYYKKLTTKTPCLFARIYGVFKIKFKGSKTICVIFENVLRSTDNAIKFDLKGSHVNRKVSNQIYTCIDDIPTTVILKDIDFFACVEYIELDLENRQRLFSSLTSDLEILRRRHIMDYSLLLAIQDPEFDRQFEATAKYRVTGYIKGKRYFCYLAVIDFLQIYTFKKKAELQIKSLTHTSSHLSSIPAAPYMQRFLDNLSKVFIMLHKSLTF